MWHVRRIEEFNLIQHWLMIKEFDAVIVPACLHLKEQEVSLNNS
jgi:hypothetical protein